MILPARKQLLGRARRQKARGGEKTADRWLERPTKRQTVAPDQKRESLAPRVSNPCLIEQMNLAFYRMMAMATKAIRCL
jgi:hypothetical protein